MKLKKSTIFYFLMGLSIVTACKKIDYQSRDISGLKPDPIVVVPPDPGVQYIVFDNCDVKDGWDIVGPSNLETQGKKEGTGYLSSKIVIGEDFMQFQRKLTAPIDTKLTLTTGQFIFWLYISDVTALKKDGQIQISSSLDPDKNRVGWGLAEIIPTLKNGWNQLTLDLSKGGLTGDGGPNLAAMNYFRIFFWTDGKAKADLVTGIDDLKFLKVQEPPKSSVMLDNCDQLDGWDIALGTGSIETQGKKEGTGYIRSRITPNEDFMRYAKKFSTAIDSKVTEQTGQLSFWFYVQDPAQLKEGQIQMSSAGDPDKERYGWDIKTIIPNLKIGWNEVNLNFTDAYKADGDIPANLTKVNYFRMFFNTTTKVTADFVTGIDGLRIKEK